METTHSTALATAGRVLFGVAVTAGAAVHGFFWLIVGGFSCDESCDGGSWHGTPDAWQWQAMTVLGFASFMLAVGFAIALALRGPRWVTIGFAAAAAATAIAPWIISAT
jgi:hypothetical protein